MAKRPNQPSQTVRNRVLGSKVVPLDALMGNPENWRIHPQHQRDILAGSFDELGIIKSIQVVERQGGYLIVDGHARALVLRHRGVTEVPVEVTDLTDAEVRKALMVLDPITDLADIDFGKGRENLSQIEEGTNEALYSLFAGLEAKFDEAGKLAEAMDGRTETNFHSVQKAFKERKIAIKLVLSLDETELVEEAFAATENKNRAQAMTEICRAYLESKGKTYDSDSAGQQHRTPEDRIAQELVGAHLP